MEDYRVMTLLRTFKLEASRAYQSDDSPLSFLSILVGAVSRVWFHQFPTSVYAKLFEVAFTRHIIAYLMYSNKQLLTRAHGTQTE
jgi:hypothetical protein